MTTLQSNYQMAGRFKLQRIKASTGEVVETREFKNLITDIGLNRVGTGGAITYAYVSTNATAPTVADTALAGFLASTSTQQPQTTNSTSSSPYWTETTSTYRFAAGAAAGNLTKVGVGWSANSTAGLWSSALIVDGNGNPTSLTVLADEFLDVAYTLRYYPPLADSTYVVSISGVNYTITSRAAFITSRSMASGGYMLLSSSSTVHGGAVSLGPVTGSLTGGVSGGGGSMTPGTYVNNSLRVTSTWTAGLGAANVSGGIAGIQIGGTVAAFLSCPVQMTISPPIPKDSTKVLNLTFATSWSRYP